jgi:serine phosphatase RsbU (regulator of sigma subunit)
MKPSRPAALSGLPLSAYLIFFIVLIILIVIGVLTLLSYTESQDQLIRHASYLQSYTEENVIESVTLVDRGLKVYDDTLNRRMQPGFPAFLAAYREAGGDPHRIDLEGLRKRMDREMEGRVDLYIINESGVIIASTVPAVLHLDFRQDFPEYYARLNAGRLGDSFFADRVVRSVAEAGDLNVTGELRKFAFMPTPDRRYLLEMGLTTDEFARERGQLSYVGAAEQVREFNPNLVGVRLFDANYNLLTDKGINPGFSPDPDLTQILDRMFANGTTIQLNDPMRGTETRYLYINLNDNATASDMSLVIELSYTDKYLHDKLSAILVYYFVIGLLAVFMGIILAWGATRHLTDPIGKIVADVDLIAGGDLDHRIRSMDNAEFTRLERSINLMIRRIKDYSAKIERDQAELRLAADIQRALLPGHMPGIPGFAIAAETVPAKEVGGDFYNLIPLSSGRIGIVIADVSGKGVPAALFMALAGVVLRVNAVWHHDPTSVVRDANGIISQDSQTGMFVTLVYGVLDPGRRTFTYVNAGHNPPIRCTGGRGGITELRATGIALGVQEDSDFAQAEVRFESGDSLILYTDGVTEAFNERGEMFGEERLRRLIAEHQDLGARELADRIIAEAASFRGREPQADDITLVILKADG